MVKRPKSGQRGSKRAKNGKPEDDAALWQAFTQNVDPLELQGRVPDSESALWEEMLRRKTDKATLSNGAEDVLPGSKVTGKATGNTKPALIPKQARITPSKPTQAPPTNQINSRQVRRIGSGRSGIDGRIDLHGMRQNEAHGALRVFLFRAVAKGHRMVLVITGKGRANDEQSRFGEFVNEGGLGRGVLRRSVPLWLEEPDLRAIVVGYTTAHIKHGGEGALYVQLRRR